MRVRFPMLAPVRWLLVCLALSVATLVPVVASAQADQPGGIASPSALVRTGRFASAALGRSMPYRVILPDDYDASARRYPTLYLLHGLFGTFSDWESRTDIFLASRAYPLIIVMPEGENSWYTDSQGEPAQKFERYITTDLIAHIDETYRTVRSRHARAIAGLSMGGYGAIKMALKHPGQFAVAGSLSGAFDAGHDPALDTTFGEKIAVQMRAIYGPSGSATRVANDLFLLADKVESPASLPFLYFDCGSSDRFLESNRQFAALLQKKQAAYEYRETPGGHSWDYWDRQVRALLQLLAVRLPM